MQDRIVVALTGATGQRYGIRALEMLADTECESHLVLSRASKLNIVQETDLAVEDVAALADHTHEHKNVGAPPASGSFATRGMLVTPCSMKTLSNIAHGNSGNLITRAADVTLKERRTLVLMPREKPLNRIHLKNMLEATDAGAVIMPPLPSFYNNPETIDEMVSRTVARTLSLFDIEMAVEEWMGFSSAVDSAELTSGQDGEANAAEEDGAEDS